MSSYIGNQPVPQATQTRDRFVATSAQTSFATSGYTPGFLDVYLNGVHLDATDYTATNGSDVVLASGAASGDIVEVVAYSAFEIARLYDSSTNSTGYFALPAGTTAQRPSQPAAGYVRMNTTTGSVEFYDGTNWISTNLIPTINSISGNIYAGASSTLTLSLTNATDVIDVKYYEGGTLLATDNNVTVTSGSATSTVPSAVYGQTAGDTISIKIFNQDGTPSSNSINKTVMSLPSGGTITTTGSYRVHTFTSSSTFTVPSGFSANAEYLIVAGGGGGGGGRHAGGAGAGGLLDNVGGTPVSISANSYSIIVGAGGGGGSVSGPAETNGSNSSALGLTAIGGGHGGGHGGSNTIEQAGSGGSGGGSGHTAGTPPGSGTTGQGFAGSRNVPDRSVLPSGGGAAGKGVANGSGGETSSTGKGDDGGPGKQVNIDGNNYYYAGGGGGSGSPQAPGYLGAWGGGAGGIGGGGGGASSGGGGSYGGAGGGSARNSGGTGVATQTTNAAHGGAGGANTGGGGGGAAGWSSTGNGNGGNGGSGIVIIRYIPQ